MAYYSDRPLANAGSAAGIGGLLNTAVRSYGTTDPKRSLLASAFATFSAWNDRRLTRKTLMALSDRELDDIGLNRGDIETVARR
ncbi:DUF1127 domain-containing protein [Ponticoccus alexandrii]|uniref:DUF1127 domain-containing protein n=2 Tax=Ponticoccus alexandrii TaxID=1943633 RepID=A0ABX7FE87_9RHOB|nr:hypothetical protein P279_15995 [Rhodobacteraceae bacterium PD-2]MBN7783828.1 DUF1127 domain-containing protein [Enemella evansiae]QRF67899.1 DUF1127 domain-containing protein [Ponticoccus alexandrii]